MFHKVKNKKHIPHTWNEYMKSQQKIKAMKKNQMEILELKI